MRRLELDPPALSLANSVMEKALQGGKQLTRAQLELFLVQAGVISAADPSLRFLFVLMNAELEGVICSGARRGKQHTYALLEERAPAAKLLARDEAIPELARRYFASRGPATLKDFTWWSGLSGMDATTALAMIKPQLTELNIAGQTYWLDPSSQSGTAQAAPAVYLLPNYDEYVVSYADRSAIYDLAIVKQVDARGNFLFNHTIVIDGQVMGTWKRDLKKGEVIITPNLFIPLSKMQNQALVAEMDRYARFLEMPFRVETVEGSIK
jgi:hypothetical protein